MKSLIVFFVAVVTALFCGGSAWCASHDPEISARAKKTYTVRVSAGANGKVSGKKSTKVSAGGKIEFTVTPAKKYLIDSLTVNGAPRKGLPTKVGKSYKLKLTKINENTNVSVSFTTQRTLSSLALGSQITVVDAK